MPDEVKAGSDLQEAMLEEAKPIALDRVQKGQQERHFYHPSDLHELKIQEPEYIIDPIIPRRRLILLIGNSTAGKTPFCYQLAGDVVSGRDVLGYFRHCGKPCRVAMLDAESPVEDIKLRLDQQRKRRPIEIPENLFILDIGKVMDNGYILSPSCNIEKLVRLAREERIDLLILDNLWALSGGADILRANVVQPILRGLRAITMLPHGPSVLILHHPRKGPREKKQRASILKGDFAVWLEEASGSYTLVNLTDVRLGLERVEVKGSDYTVFRGRTRVPGREQDIGPLYLAVDEEHSLAETDRRPEVLQNLSDKMAGVEAVLRGLQPPFTTKDVYEAVKGNCSKRTIRRTIAFLRAHGFLKDVPGGFEWL